MSIFGKMRNASWRLSALVATAAAVVIVPAVVLAHGPDRPTYTVNNPADHITFNSITDNPYVGDERNFVRIKDTTDSSNSGWTDNLNVQAGHEYYVQLYVHNNAATSLNLTATNTTATATVPTNVGRDITVEGFINADNAAPKEIWDQAIFHGSSDFSLSYIPGSATMYNNAFPKGTAVSDSIVTSTGAKIGYDKMDGNLPGCFQYAGYVNFKVKVNTPKSANFTVNKQVSKHGANNWQESYAAQPGETVDYIINYKNTDSATQNNVVVKDTIPAGMTYVNGSTKYGTTAHPNGVQASDNVTKDGINIGSYAQNGGTWVMFSAKVNNNDQLPVCGGNTLINVARVTTDFGYKEDTANVTVNKTCAPGTPTELPKTGISTGLMTFIGLGLATAAGAYALQSDRARKLFNR